MVHGLVGMADIIWLRNDSKVANKNGEDRLAKILKIYVLCNISFGD